MKIYLIGFMGSGKTSVGKHLAKKLGYDFLDMDDYIEKTNQKTIPDIFREDGEDKFRELEKKALSYTFSLENTVISAGGGTPCFFDNMEQINNNGTSFYIKKNIDFFVYKLLNAKTERPLVKGKSEDELKKYITETLNYREQFYSKADYIIYTYTEKKKEIAEMIIEKLKK